jgi:uracil-DNA glycosylase
MNQNVNLSKLLREIARCQVCADTLPFGPRPVVQAAPGARILIIGQAPGSKVHQSGVPWDDASGKRLRAWMRVDRTVFYDAARIAIMPMGFCYPGASEKGGDLPPRPECAPLWHPRLLAALPDIRLTLLLGQYAQRYYLAAARKESLTETVRAHTQYAPRFFPLPHPSWRSTIWMRRNPWFEDRVIPALRKAVRQAL